MKETKSNYSRRLYEFGSFVLDTEAKLLLQRGEPIPLSSKSFEILLAIVESGGRVVTKEDLIDRIRPGIAEATVDFDQDISHLCKILGVGGKSLIQFIPGRGYRFDGEIMEISSGEEEIDLRPEIVSSLNEPPKNSEKKSSSSLLPYQLAIALICLISSLAISYFLFFRQPPKRNFRSAGPRLLAVVPFRNLKAGKETDFISFSLADAIISRLNNVNSIAVRPAPYLDKYLHREIDPQKIAVELNVNTILTGTYLKEGDNLRITTQLLDMITNEVLWRDSLDLRYEKLMTMQDVIARQVIQKLQLRLSSEETERLNRDTPNNPLAYEYYLRGNDFLFANRLPQAIEMIEKSLRLDPNYAAAWAEAGTVYNARASLSQGSPDDYALVQKACEKALQLNPEQNEARLSLAYFLTQNNRVEDAVPMLRDIVKANSSIVQAHWELSHAYRFGGMLEESNYEAERARRLDSEIKASPSIPITDLYLGQYEKFLHQVPPTESAPVNFYRGLGHYYLKDFSQAAKDFEQAYRLNPRSPQTAVGKVLASIIRGQRAEAFLLLREIQNLTEERKINNPEILYKIAQASAVLGEKKAALILLRRSIDEGFFCFPYFQTDPLLENLRGEKDFDAALNAAQTRSRKFREKFF